jgi:hypothetical protein
VQSKKSFVISESSYPDTCFDHGREPLVKQLTEAHDHGERDAAVVALLQLEISEPLRFPKRTMNGLVWYLRVPVCGSRPR